MDKVKHVFHQYTIKTKNRPRIIKNLISNKIGFGIYYPKPLHYYSHLSKYSHNDLKISESLAEKVLSLPVHPALKNNDLQKIVETVNGVFQHHDK